ncbi:gluconate 2-dehydrogenase subunit 3 family protein [Haloarcula salinisoli]|uniref:Gluconate 2-dehydrogenase subunit 3 family protein n=1 Tax=Haloarcula salinisoli TaxID=2487746 RepID=A0A8J7YFF5_9EURY|nr:gluconate 2-dehydrogenase subunit 3 family protein [Halomicroarcula salinisoli]MBX0286462.1 gluconate 2-dehydrogenase subunit 3 family protein [Halomicroarcula salinisoli]MBX0302049.1 gluconate 2-dehydrogenase subunit 3 family protein [Halomicroarcula salinisoli]
MELTRRDALIALGGLGLPLTAWLEDSEPTATELTSEDIETLLALSETLYPSDVTVNSDFIETFVAGQHQLDSDHTSGIVSALTGVRRASSRQTGRRPTELDPSERGDLLRSMGAARAYPDPDGTSVQQIRYYVINNLLYALYTTPKGGELVGNPNPPGYPGGTTAYQAVSTDE